MATKKPTKTKSKPKTKVKEKVKKPTEKEIIQGFATSLIIVGGAFITTPAKDTVGLS